MYAGGPDLIPRALNRAQVGGIAGSKRSLHCHVGKRVMSETKVTIRHLTTSHAYPESAKPSVLPTSSLMSTFVGDCFFGDCPAVSGPLRACSVIKNSWMILSRRSLSPASDDFRMSSITFVIDSRVIKDGYARNKNPGWEGHTGKLSLPGCSRN